jgi:hypothetical protein
LVRKEKLKLNYFEPFNSYIDLEEKKLNPEGDLIIRKLSDMVDMFQNKEASKEALTYFKR